ncbi:MAG: TonB-dependent receptor [Sphingomonadaceae bacterium]
MSISCALSAGLSTPAIAQQPGEAAAAQGGLDAIVVTARKRAETLQDIPVSMTAISSEDIARNDLTSLEKIAASTPQFTIARASNGSGAQLSLRGIGSSFTSIGIAQSVATVVDGVYYGQGRIINEGMFDLERIEILKGPQSLFYGKNSTAGVISITTAGPTESLEVSGRVGYEFRADQLVGEVAVSGPISDTLGFRVAARGSKMWDGYVRNVAGPSSLTSFDVATGDIHVLDAAPAVGWGPREKELLARATLEWQPIPEFTATVKASITRSRNENPSWNYIIFGCAAGVGPVLEPGSPCTRDFRNAQNAFPTEVAENFPYAKEDGGLGNTYNSEGVTATLNYEFDSVTLTSVTNYNENKNIFVIDGDYFSSAETNIWGTERDKFRAFSSEFRALTTYDGPVNLLAGAYYQKTKLSVRGYFNLGGVEDSTAPAALRYVAFDKDSNTKGETIAGFGQIIWNVVPQVELTGGVRYTHETKSSYFNQPYINAGMTSLFIQNDPFTSDQNFNNWSPEVTFSYKPVENMNIYAAYKTGYKSGGFSNTAIFTTGSSRGDLSFNGESASGFEGGVKGYLFDRQLRVDLGIYTYKFSDLQVDYFNAAAFSFITTNAGSARTKGVELALEMAPYFLPGLNLRGSINYNKARYVDYIAPCYAGQTPVQGCTMNLGGVPMQDISGQPTANAPEWTGSFGATFETPVSSSLDLSISADARYSDSYLASAFANLITQQNSYISLDSAIRLGTADGRWEIALIGRNLTNRFVLTGANDVAGTGGGTGTANGVPALQNGLVSLPRTVKLQVGFNF